MLFKEFRMKKLYSRKIVPFEIPGDARELTDEEMLLVNGGGRVENSDEGVAGAKPGDYIIRDNNEKVVLKQIDIDLAQEKVGDGANTLTNPNGSSGSGGSSGGSSGSSGSSSISATNTGNDCTANTVKDPDHHSAYDQQYINEMMENARKNALGGNEIQGNAVAGKKVEEKEIKVNPGAGNMTITDYIAQQRKMGADTTVSGQTVGGEKVEGQVVSGMSAGETVDTRNRGFTLTTDNYPEAYGTGKKTDVWIVRNDDGLGNEFNATRYIYKDGKLVYQDVVGANCAPSKIDEGFTTPDGIYYLSNEILYHQEDGTSNSESYKNVLSLMTRDSNIPKATRDEINIGDRLLHSDEKYDAATGTLTPYSEYNYPYGAGCIISDSQEAHDSMMSVLMDGVNDPRFIQVRIVSLSNIPGFNK